MPIEYTKDVKSNYLGGDNFTATATVDTAEYGDSMVFDVTVTTGDLDFTVATLSAGSYNFVVDWGDESANDTITVWDDIARTHTYTRPGTFRVTLTGTCTRINYNNEAASAAKITKVHSIGNTGLTDFGYLFRNLTNCTSLDFGSVVSTGVTNFLYSFAGYGNCTSIKNIDRLDVSAATTMYGMLTNYSSMRSPVDLSGLDTSNVELIGWMLSGWSSAGAGDFGLDAWDVSSLTDAANFMNGSEMSIDAYERMLVAWAGQTVNPNVVAHFGNSRYRSNGTLGPEEFGEWTTLGTGITLLAPNDLQYLNAPNARAQDGTGSVEIGVTYEVEFEIYDYVSGGLQVRLGAQNGQIFQGNGIHKDTITAHTNNLIRLYSNDPGGNTTAKARNFTVKAGQSGTMPGEVAKKTLEDQGWVITDGGPVQTTATLDEWYVQPSGAPLGAADGTSPTDPWNGISAIVWGAGGVMPGDTLNLLGGTYSNESMYVANNNTDETLFTTIRSYPGENAVFDGGGTGTSITVNDTQYLNIEDIEIFNNDHSAIRINGGVSHITIKNCDIHDITQHGIRGTADGGTASHWLVEDCRIYRCGYPVEGDRSVGAGILFTTGTDGVVDDITVRRNHFAHIAGRFGYSCYPSSSPHTGGQCNRIYTYDNVVELCGSSGIDYTKDVFDSEIYNNVISGCGGTEGSSGIHCGGVLEEYVTRCKIFDNTVIGHKLAAVDGAGILADDYTQDIDIYRNILIDNEECGVKLHNCEGCTVTDNAIVGGDMGIKLPGCDNFTITGNTISYCNAGIRFTTANLTYSVTGNIMHLTGIGFQVDSNSCTPEFSQGNCFFKNPVVIGGYTVDPPRFEVGNNVITTSNGDDSLDDAKNTCALQ